MQDEKAKSSKTRLQAKSKIASLNAQLEEAKRMTGSMTGSVVEGAEQVSAFIYFRQKKVEIAFLLATCTNFKIVSKYVTVNKSEVTLFPNFIC